MPHEPLVLVASLAWLLLWAAVAHAAMTWEQRHADALDAADAPRPLVG